MASNRPIRAASAAGARGRGHATLAPAHLGEAAAAATVAVVVGGIALAITGIGMLALALTLGSRYAGDPPPNLGSLVLTQSVAGILVTLLGTGLTAGGIGVLGASRRARTATAVLSGVATAAAAIGTILVATSTPGSMVIAVALGLAALVFGSAAFLLSRGSR